MNRRLRSKLVRLARKAAQSHFIRSLMSEGLNLQSLRPLDEFVSSNGNRFQRLDGYRDLISPDWRDMFKPKPDPPVATQDGVVSARRAVSEMERFLLIYGVSMVGKEIMEVGCHGGAHAMHLPNSVLNM